MKKAIFSKLALMCFVTLFLSNVYAQQIQTVNPAAIYSSSVGGARILSGQGNTAANPAIGFSGVTGQYPKNNLNDGGGGNGIFRPLANTMAFSTASTERLRITSGGLIGVNTSNPTSILHIKCSTSNKGLRLESLESGSGNFLIVDADGYVRKSCATVSCNNNNVADLAKIKQELEETKRELERLSLIVNELQKK